MQTLAAEVKKRDWLGLPQGLRNGARFRDAPLRKVKVGEQHPLSRQRFPKSECQSLLGRRSLKPLKQLDRARGVVPRQRGARANRIGNRSISRRLASRRVLIQHPGHQQQTIAPVANGMPCAEKPEAARTHACRIFTQRPDGLGGKGVGRYKAGKHAHQVNGTGGAKAVREGAVNDRTCVGQSSLCTQCRVQAKSRSETLSNLCTRQ